MYCLDTNILVDILRGDKILGDKISNLMEQGVEFFITPITLCELYRGAYGHVHKERKLQEISSFIANFELLELDAASCEGFGKTYRALRKQGKLIDDFDIVIACIVKSNELVLVTRDNNFGNTGVKVEHW